MTQVSLSCINVPPESVEYVNDVLQGGDIGQNSPYISQLERALCELTGARHCIAVSSGTMADAVAVAAMKVKYNPRRIVVPALTFIAQPNAAYYNGLDIEFVDITEEYGMSWREAESFDPRTSLFFPSDCLGRIALKGRGLNQERVIEDACEAFGSLYQGHPAGRFGEVGTFSFFVSHTLAAGEGGAIITDDDWLAHLCYSIRSHGRSSNTYAQDKFRFPFLGFNAKMPALTAAFACGVMRHIRGYLALRHSRYELMQSHLKNFPEAEGEYLVPHGFPAVFGCEMDRDTAMRNLLGAGIECRKFFSCIPTMEEAYKFKRQFLGRYRVAEWVAFTHLYVPCHQNMTTDDVKTITQIVSTQNGHIKGEA